jgi:hypothetical protein
MSARIRIAIGLSTALTLWLATGCSWMAEQPWPWRKPETPIIPASGQQPPSEDPTAAAPPQDPDAPDETATAPAPDAPDAPETAEAPERDDFGGYEDDFARAQREGPESPEPSGEIAPAEADGAEAATEPLPEGQTELVAAPGLLIYDRFITVEEILRDSAGQLSQLPADLELSEFRLRAAEIIRENIRGIVYDAMVLPEAKKKIKDAQMQFVDQKIDEFLRERLAEFGGSRQELEAHYRQMGTTLEETLDTERDALLVKLFLDLKFRPAIAVNRRMLMQYYREHLDEEFTREKKVRMHVLAAPFEAFAEDNADPDEARRLARVHIRAAREAIEEGMSFPKAVETYSRGPLGRLWPMMGEGNFREEAVEEAAFELEEGEVSDIVRTESGLYLVKAEEVRPGGVVPFEDAQEPIRKILENRQMIELRQEYFQQLYRKALLQEPQPVIQLAVDRAVARYRNR